MSCEVSINPREILILAACVCLFGCAGTRPVDLGISDSRLTSCPPSPNCVSSDATDPEHAIAPLPASAGWGAARAAVAGLPRTRIVTETRVYIHAESRSLLFRYVDDLELHLRAREGIIAVRSASRIGHGDMGVNRRRVERLRALLAAED
jgi:uncharacterized protein (DUF1499 family)